MRMAVGRKIRQLRHELHHLHEYNSMILSPNSPQKRSLSLLILMELEISKNNTTLFGFHHDQLHKNLLYNAEKIKFTALQYYMYTEKIISHVFRGSLHIKDAPSQAKLLNPIKYM